MTRPFCAAGSLARTAAISSLMVVMKPIEPSLNLAMR